MSTILERLTELQERLQSSKVPQRAEDAKTIEDAIQGMTELMSLASVKPPLIHNIEGKRVMILTPIYRGMNGRTFFTLWRCFAQYGVDKVGLIPEFQTVIHEARNMLAKAFLETDSEWCIMVDDDLLIPCGSSQITNRYFNARLPEPLASINAISRIMSHPPECKVVGGLYFVKGNPSFSRHRNSGRAICEQAFRDDDFNSMLHQPKPTSGLIPQDWVAIGFCRIHRNVFEDIIKAIPGRWPECLPSHDGGHYGIFQPIGPNVNEDVSFGRRCKAIGIQHYLDSGLVCGHCDGTSIFWPHSTI